MPTHEPLAWPPRASDLFGFKAHFRDARLPPGLHAAGALSRRLWRHGAQRRWTRRASRAASAVTRSRHAGARIPGVRARGRSVLAAHAGIVPRRARGAAGRPLRGGVAVGGADPTGHPHVRARAHLRRRERRRRGASARGRRHQHGDPVGVAAVRRARRSPRTRFSRADARAALATVGRDYERTLAQQLRHARSRGLALRASDHATGQRRQTSRWRGVAAILTLGARWSGKAQSRAAPPSVGAL